MKFKNLHYIFFLVLFFVIFYFIYPKNNSYTGFKIINNRNITVFTTQNWFTYQPTDTKHNFKVSIPYNWSAKETVLYLDNQKKAEFSPGIVKLNKNQKCFDTEWFNEAGESELVSISDLSVNNFDGRLLIERTTLSSDNNNTEFIYPYFYCLTNGNYAFVITFYEKNVTLNNQDFHKSILSTLVF